MDSMIKEINENLKAIVENIKSNKNDLTEALSNIQNQMDKNVEEAKKYKDQVDSEKERIRDLEEENKSLEYSLDELKEKYSKLNLVSVIEAGNSEIKSKINNNNNEINRCKDHVLELTNKARTIRDLLVNLKKDKEAKEVKLDSCVKLYDYYNVRINEITDYAYNHSDNLDASSYFKHEDIDVADVNDVDIDNTMVFDQIADIDENNSFKDEVTLINNQIDDEMSDVSFNKYEDSKSSDELDNIFNIFNENGEVNAEDGGVENIDDNSLNIVEEINGNREENLVNPFDVSINADDDSTGFQEPFLPENNAVDINENPTDNSTISEDTNTTIEPAFDDNEAGIDNNGLEQDNNTNIEEKIDGAYEDIFGSNINEEIKVEDNSNVSDATYLDIFGNKITEEDPSTPTTGKSIEDIFKDNGLDFNLFREDEKNYLKQIYNEETFVNIFSTLKRNGISLRNIYKAFNIFGEITANELENIISRLINIGQSTEAIGLVLEKLPRVKKYDLNGAIDSFGEFVKDVDITELIMRAKELSNGGNN